MLVQDRGEGAAVTTSGGRSSDKSCSALSAAPKVGQLRVGIWLVQFPAGKPPPSVIYWFHGQNR
jgi:hypothetical protein